MLLFTDAASNYWQCLQVFLRLTNYTESSLTASCDANYLEYYDVSTSVDDFRQRHCNPPYLPWISGDSTVQLRLHAHSIRTLPEFRLFGNIYVSGKPAIHDKCQEMRGESPWDKVTSHSLSPFFPPWFTAFIIKSNCARKSYLIESCFCKF